jgi:hypothetical protein
MVELDDALEDAGDERLDGAADKRCATGHTHQYIDIMFSRMFDRFGP